MSTPLPVLLLSLVCSQAGASPPPDSMSGWDVAWLVTLARENPNVAAAEAFAAQRLAESQGSWTSAFEGITVGVGTEYSAAGGFSVQPTGFVQLNVGRILALPTNALSKSAGARAAESQAAAQRSMLEAEVRRRYAAMVHEEAVLRLRQHAKEVAATASKLAEIQFAAGGLDLSTLADLQGKAISAAVTAEEAESLLQIERLGLEAVIGMTLDRAWDRYEERAP